jgi:hypothetical protein
MGMGVGENPLYFCERGYYIKRERDMLLEFRKSGFAFLQQLWTKRIQSGFCVNVAFGHFRQESGSRTMIC